VEEMSLNSLKTTGYDDILEFIMVAMSLYEADDTTSRLQKKLTFSAKQEVYISILHDRLVDAFYLQNSHNIALFDRIFDYAEELTRFTLTTPVRCITSQNELINCYRLGVLPLVTAMLLRILIVSDQYNIFLKTIHDLLSSKNDISKLDSSVRKYLNDILNKFNEKPSIKIKNNTTLPNTKKGHTKTIRPKAIESMFASISNLISEIKLKNGVQLKSNVSQKFKIAIKNHPKFIIHLNNLKTSYYACIFLLRINNAPLFFDVLVEKYQSILRGDEVIDNFNVNVAMCNLTKTQDYNPRAVYSYITSNEVGLIGYAVKKIPRLPTNYNLLNYIERLKWLLNIEGILSFRKHISLDAAIAKFASSDDKFLPYNAIAEACKSIQENKLTEAINIIDSNVDIISKVQYMFIEKITTLYIGCLIKTNKISHNQLKGLARILICTHKTYADNSIRSQYFLGVKYESFISDESFTIIRAISDYNNIISNCLCIQEEEPISFKSPFLEEDPFHEEVPEQIIDSALIELEMILQKICFYRIDFECNNLTDTQISNATASLKSYFKEISLDNKKNLISFIPGSSLYDCICELDLLYQYLDTPWSIDGEIAAIVRNKDLEFRRAILKAIDTRRFNKENILK
jgi:hypothetical protein